MTCSLASIDAISLINKYFLYRFCIIPCSQSCRLDVLFGNKNKLHRCLNVWMCRTIVYHHRYFPFCLLILLVQFSGPLSEHFTDHPRFVVGFILDWEGLYILNTRWFGNIPLASSGNFFLIPVMFEQAETAWDSVFAL